MTTVAKQKAKLDKMVDALAKEQAKLLIAERAEQRKKAREVAREKAKERAALFRSADAHRKILLGGLVIAAGADVWDEAVIVAALLVVSERLAAQPALREQLRAKGIEHLQQRQVARGKP